MVATGSDPQKKRGILFVRLRLLRSFVVNSVISPTSLPHNFHDEIFRISTFFSSADLRCRTNVLRESAMKPRLALIALGPVFAVSLVAQQTPAPPQASQPQSQVQGRGQGRGPGAAGGRRGAAPQRDVTTPAGTGVIAGRVVAADTGKALRHARVVAG